MYLRDDELHNVNIAIAFDAPSWTDKDFFSMQLFKNILGDYRADQHTGKHLNTRKKIVLTPSDQAIQQLPQLPRSAPRRHNRQNLLLPLLRRGAFRGLLPRKRSLREPNAVPRANVLVRDGFLCKVN